jgi:predicted nucleotidyltransferase
MRRIASKGSAIAFYLDRPALLGRLRTAALQALEAFPQVAEVLLFGSLARGTHTGLSDIDLAILLSPQTAPADPLERARPFQRFFFERLSLGVDVITCGEHERASLAGLLEGSLSLARRPAAAR